MLFVVVGFVSVRGPVVGPSRGDSMKSISGLCVARSKMVVWWNWLLYVRGVYGQAIESVEMAVLLL